MEKKEKEDIMNIAEDFSEFAGQYFMRSINKEHQGCENILLFIQASLIQTAEVIWANCESNAPHFVFFREIARAFNSYADVVEAKESK